MLISNKLHSFRNFLRQSYKKKCTAQKSSASFLSYIRQAISKFNGNKFVSGLY